MHRRFDMTAISTYTSVGKVKSSPESTSFFMMNNLLYSRIESGYPSNDDCFDEDVNVYLASLLESLIHPEYHQALKRYVVPYDLLLFESIRNEKNPRVKYLTYKINADFLLVSMGIFNNASGTRPNSTPHMNFTTETYIGRGKTYYSLAQSYLVQTLRQSTAIADILGKLSKNFEKYVKTLSVMKSEYFNIFDRISNGELYHLECSIREKDITKQLSRTYDEFLDAYSRFRKENSTESKKIVKEKAAQLRKLDLSFEFDID